MKIFVRLFLILAMTLTSCVGGQPIPEDDFTEILHDIYLANAYFKTKNIDTPRWQDSIPYNRLIVEQYGYTWAQFDSTIAWYTRHPRQYQNVYEDVINLLKTSTELVSQELDPPSNIWEKLSSSKRMVSCFDSCFVSIPMENPGKYKISAEVSYHSFLSDFQPTTELLLLKNDTLLPDTLRLNLLPMQQKISFDFISYPTDYHSVIEGNLIKLNTTPLDTNVVTNYFSVDNIEVIYTPIKFEELNKKSGFLSNLFDW